MNEPHGRLPQDCPAQEEVAGGLRRERMRGPNPRPERPVRINRAPLVGWVFIRQLLATGSLVSKPRILFGLFDLPLVDRALLYARVTVRADQLAVREHPIRDDFGVCPLADRLSATAATARRIGRA
jgi:hypothetical protein